MRGGYREGAGRPKGAIDPRLTPEATREALDALRLPDESWAAFGRRIGQSRASVGMAVKRGLSERVLGQWAARASGVRG